MRPVETIGQLHKGYSIGYTLLTKSGKNKVNELLVFRHFFYKSLCYASAKDTQLACSANIGVYPDKTKNSNTRC